MDFFSRGFKRGDSRSRQGSVFIVVIIIVVVLAGCLWFWLSHRSVSQLPNSDFSALKTYAPDALPPAVPSSFPLVKKINSVGSASTVLSGGVIESIFAFTSFDTPQDIYNFYKQYLMTNGWIIVKTSTSSSVLIENLAASQGSNQIFILSFASSSSNSLVSVQFYSH